MHLYICGLAARVEAPIGKLKQVKKINYLGLTNDIYDMCIGVCTCIYSCRGTYRQAYTCTTT